MIIYLSYMCIISISNVKWLCSYFMHLPVQETYGEDPYLSSEMARSYVSGLQGPDKRILRANAGCKHFDAYGGPDSPPATRFSADAKVMYQSAYQWVRVDDMQLRGPLLLTWYTFKPIMNMWLHPLARMGRNYLSIPQIQQRLHHCIHYKVWE